MQLEFLKYVEFKWGFRLVNSTKKQQTSHQCLKRKSIGIAVTPSFFDVTRIVSPTIDYTPLVIVGTL
jgi:hypothetical protein